MFQQFLDLQYLPPRLYTGLHPTGGRDEPCDVKCSACSYTATAPNWTAARNLAAAHDWDHDRGVTKTER